MLKILQHSGLEKKLCYRTVARVNKFYILIRYSKIGCTFLFLQSPIYQKIKKIVHQNMENITIDTN
jgi:hypothetical protein